MKESGRPRNLSQALPVDFQKLGLLGTDEYHDAVLRLFLFLRLRVCSKREKKNRKAQ